MSHALAYKVIGTPSGWTLCGVIGLAAMVTPVLRPVATLVNWLYRDPEHCHKAVLRSIDRATITNPRKDARCNLIS